jgi:hypothetical protein
MAKTKKKTTSAKTAPVSTLPESKMVDVSAELDLHRQIKAAEAVEREKALKKAKITIITDGDDSDRREFDVWWMDINRRVTMKSWMKEIVKADFKGRGLSDKETIESYDAALRVFGLKF